MNKMDLSARCCALETDLARLRSSHDELLATAKLAIVELRINWHDPTLREVACKNLDAAIAKAEELVP
jgi:hypothetical protein